MTKTTKNIISISILSVIVFLIGYFSFIYHEDIYQIIVSQEKRDEFVSFVQDSGFVGVLSFLGLQILQIIIAVIPGEPIELIAGALYGTVGGAIISLIGVFFGTVLIYYFVLIFAHKKFDEKKLYKYKFLKDKKRVHVFLFIVYFIPGTPKDAINYIGPFLPVKPINFFLISTFARIPSIISSTYAGAHIVQGRMTHAIIVFAIATVIAIIGFLCYGKIINLFNKIRTK